MTKDTDPLLPPYLVPNAALDIRFARMTPDEIRAAVRTDAELGRHKYEDLFAAAVRALGPTSPEALSARPQYGRALLEVQQSSGPYVTTDMRGGFGNGYHISSRCIVGTTVEFVRVPEVGTMPECPSNADVYAAHEAAVLRFAEMAEKWKAAEAAKEAESAAPEVSA